MPAVRIRYEHPSPGVGGAAADPWLRPAALPPRSPIRWTEDSAELWSEGRRVDPGRTPMCRRAPVRPVVDPAPHPGGRRLRPAERVAILSPPRRRFSRAVSLAR